MNQRVGPGHRLTVGVLGLVLVLSACGTSSPTPNGLIGAPDASLPVEQALATEVPVPTAAPTPVPPSSNSLSVKVTKRTAKVQQNATASVTIKTKARASCDIDVEYQSGPSQASGLGDKKADAKGVITWIWTVGSSTMPGKWPIYVSCRLGNRSGSASTNFTVQ